MNLHENASVFSEVIRLAAAEFNIPQSYVEKDYYLTRSLMQLSKNKYSDNIVFKGGTSLSKIYRAIYRFSEDIDLAILPGKNWTKNKIKTVVREVIKSASDGLEGSGEKFNNGSNFRKERYNFPRINSNEALGEVKSSILFECNAFTTPSPVIKRKVRSLIAEWAIRKERKELMDTYQLHGFEIQVLCWKKDIL